MLLSNLRIAYKMGGGFAIVLALLLVVGMIGFIGLGDADANLTVFRNIARVTSAIGRVQANFLQTHIAAKSFLLSGSDTDHAKTEDYVKTTENFVKELSSDANDASQMERAREIGAAIGAYNADLEKITTLRRTESNLQEKQLNTVGPEVEHALTSVMENAAKDGDAESAYRTGLILDELLLARLDVQKFLARDDDASDQAGTGALAAAARGLDDLLSRAANGKRRDQIVEAKTKFDSFAAACTTLYATHGNRTRLVRDSLDSIGPQVAKAIDDFKLQAWTQQTTLGRSASASVQTSKTIMGITALIAVILGMAGAYVIGRSITHPIRDMTGAMGRLAAGDLTVAIPATTHTDEIGKMAKAVQVFKDNAIKVDALHRDQEQAAARSIAERKEALHQMANDFEAGVLDIVKVVSSSATELRETAHTMSSVAHQATAQATTVAAAAEQATANGQTVASAAEELSSSISEISRQVTEAARISTTASEETARANIMVQKLAATADRIGEVVSLINSIAAQTNLLALNATIEAARAGDAGKGFTVVAGEVKGLANQTAKATDEIRTQITSVQDETRQAVEAIRNIGTVIDQVRQISSGIASAVEEQGAATKEIARNVQQATQGTQEVSSNIGGVRQATTTTESSAGQVLASAEDLAQNSERLRAEVTNFLDTVRAG